MVSEVALGLELLAQNRISRVLTGGAANHTLGKNERGKWDFRGYESLSKAMPRP